MIRFSTCETEKAIKSFFIDKNINITPVIYNDVKQFEYSPYVYYIGVFVQNGVVALKNEMLDKEMSNLNGNVYIFNKISSGNINTFTGYKITSNTSFDNYRTYQVMTSDFYDHCKEHQPFEFTKPLYFYANGKINNIDPLGIQFFNDPNRSEIAVQGAYDFQGGSIYIDERGFCVPFPICKIN